MTGTMTTLADETREYNSPALLAGPSAGEAKRYLAFLRAPRLPERASGFSLAAMVRVLRLYVLDLVLMAVLLSIAWAALANGFTMPRNQINDLEMTPAMLALVIVGAPMMEETIFRGWLSGRVGHIIASVVAIVASGVLSAMALQQVPGAVRFAPLVIGIALIALVVYLTRLQGPMRWFQRIFPLFYVLSTLAFALVHLFNYSEGALPVLLALVVPQLIAGSIFGYARVTYGIWSSMLLHILHNGTAIALVTLAATAGAPAV